MECQGPSLCGLCFHFNKFLSHNGAILLFHLDDMRVFRQIKEFLDMYSMLIRMKWVVLTCLPLINIVILGWRYFLFPYLVHLAMLLQVVYFNLQLHFIFLQILFGWATLLNSKHLLLTYWNKGLGLWKKAFSTIVLITTLWHSQILGNHFVWPRKCILLHLKRWLELVQSWDHLLLISQH